jgi:CheY-like chemotaxis protein
MGRRAPTPSSGVLPPDLRLEGEKLLIVDDDMRTVYALSALLQAKGADVVTAENGREALRALDASPGISCVLMDIMMPEMDGYEAIRRIRSTGRFDSLPIVVLTAKAMAAEHETCIDVGATGYLSKPVDGAKLLALLQSQLRLAEGRGGLQPS